MTGSKDCFITTFYLSIILVVSIVRKQHETIFVKVEKFNQQLLKWFSVKKIKHFIIKNLYLIKGYGPRKLIRVSWKRTEKVRIVQTLEEAQRLRKTIPYGTDGRTDKQRGKTRNVAYMTAA